MERNLKRWIGSAAIAVLAMTSFQAGGAERAWVGGNGGGPTDWDRKQNWSSNNTPGASDTAVFAGAVAASQPTVNKASSVLGIAFKSSGWTIGSGNTLTVNAGGINASATGTNTVNSAISLGAAQTWSVASGGTLVVGGVIGGGNSLTKDGAGTLSLSGANTYSGGTILNAGTIQFSAANRLSTTGAITLNGGTLNLGGFAQSTSGNVTIAGGTISNGTLTKTGGTYALQSGTASVTLAGTVGAEKTTASTMTLSGSHSYTGATKVSGGALLVNGNIASSSGVEVDSGATFGGSGIVSTISGAGTVAPGNSPGILTAESVDGSGGLDFSFEFTNAMVDGLSQPTFANAAASGNDVLRLTDSSPFTLALTASNTITVDFSAVALQHGDRFQGGFYADAGDFYSDISAAQFNYIGLGANGIQLSIVQVSANFGDGMVDGYITEFTVVPEPATTILLSLSLGGLAFAARQKRKSGEALS